MIGRMICIFGCHVSVFCVIGPQWFWLTANISIIYLVDLNGSTFTFLWVDALKKCRNVLETRLFCRLSTNFCSGKKFYNLACSVNSNLHNWHWLSTTQNEDVLQSDNSMQICFFLFLDHCLQSELSILASHFFYASRLATSITLGQHWFPI